MIILLLPGRGSEEKIISCTQRCCLSCCWKQKSSLRIAPKRDTWAEVSLLTGFWWLDSLSLKTFSLEIYLSVTCVWIIILDLIFKCLSVYYSIVQLSIRWRHNACIISYLLPLRDCLCLLDDYQWWNVLVFCYKRFISNWNIGCIILLRY
jgi:hypothetical protein